MTILLRERIEELMAVPDLRDRLIITPLLGRERQLGAATIDLRLGTEFIEIERQREGTLDPVLARGALARAARQEETVTVPWGEGIVLHPGQFLLGATLEFVHLPPTIAGQVLSRSSWGRVGLMVATAVALQPGWTGMVTLELANEGSVPIRLYPGLRVAQLLLWEAEKATEYAYDRRPEQHKYNRPMGPQSSKLPLEGDELRRIRSVALGLGVKVAHDDPDAANSS